MSTIWRRKKLSRKQVRKLGNTNNNSNPISWLPGQRIVKLIKSGSKKRLTGWDKSFTTFRKSNRWIRRRRPKWLPKNIAFNQRPIRIAAHFKRLILIPTAETPKSKTTTALSTNIIWPRTKCIGPFRQRIKYLASVTRIRKVLLGKSNNPPLDVLVVLVKVSKVTSIESSRSNSKSWAHKEMKNMSKRWKIQRYSNTIKMTIRTTSP